MTTTSLPIGAVALLPLLVIPVVVRFELFCLRDLEQTPDRDLQYLTREAWTVAILLLIPLGGIAYLTRGRTP